MSEKVLKMRWSKREKDLLIDYPDKRDGTFLYCMLCAPIPKPEVPFSFDPSFVNQLKERGYDLTTLKFSIKRNEVVE